MKYGVLDTVDGCWFGDDNGPKLFDDEFLAKCAAQVMGVQLGFAPGRCRAHPYTPGPLHLRDEIEVKRTALEALRRIEEGRLM